MQTLEEQGVLDQIVLGIAHELNNPNAFVRMNTLNLKKMFWMLRPCLDEYAQAHPEARFGPYTLEELRTRFGQHLESVLDATVRIIAIADKLKQCSATALERASTVDLGEVVEDLVAGHRFLIDRSARLTVSGGDGKGLLVEGYRLQLEQALSILVTNACDAMVERYGEESPARGQLAIGLEPQDGWCRLTIKDNGAGMDPATLNQIFVPYFTTKPQGVGEGLGMPICRSIVERHGGRIEVESRKGEGTTMVVTLPLNEERKDGQE